MGRIFNLDNPVMVFLNKVTDLIVLNILVLICCIPIVTIGASFTAMYYVLLRIRKDETTYIIKDFFHSFKSNFKDATLLWILYLLVLIVIAVDYYLIFLIGLEFLSIFKVLFFAIVILLLMSMTWGFILLSRYENTLLKTVKYSYCVGIANPIRTVVIGILMLVPWILPIACPYLIPVMLLLGFTLVGYIQTMLFEKVFVKLEGE